MTRGVDRGVLPLPARLSGAVWGHLVGDALGVPYEFVPPERIGEVTWRGHGTHDQPPGTWSDDGALMLALLDSLLSAGFDPEDQGRRAVAWRRQGRYAPGGVVFDIGTTTRAALRRLEAGVPAEEAGPEGEALGNGSLMRILPLALVQRDTPDAELVSMAQRASRVTHAHALCRVACAVHVLLVRRLLAGETDRAMVLAGVCTDLRDAWSAAEAHEELGALDALEAWTGRSGRGHVLDAFWSAWDAFAGAESYQDAVVRAVRYGKDTDTTAAITGGLAGAYFGVEGIPPDWLAGLREPAIVRPLVDRLVATDGWRTSTSHPLRIDRLDLDGVVDAASGGRVGLTFLPGKQRDGWAGKHWRDLAADLERLQDEHRVDRLVLFVEDHELADARVAGIAEAFAAADLELVRFPISDHDGLPEDPAAYRALIAESLGMAREGRHVVFACRGGLDRTGTAAGYLLVLGGVDPSEAIRRVHRARNSTLTRSDQQAFVRGAVGG